MAIKSGESEEIKRPILKSPIMVCLRIYGIDRILLTHVAINAVTVRETQYKKGTYVVLGQNNKGIHMGEMKLILIYCLY